MRPPDPGPNLKPSSYLPCHHPPCPSLHDRTQGPHLWTERHVISSLETCSYRRHPVPGHEGLRGASTTSSVMDGDKACSTPSKWSESWDSPAEPPPPLGASPAQEAQCPSLSEGQRQAQLASAAQDPQGTRTSALWRREYQPRTKHGTRGTFRHSLSASVLHPGPGSRGGMSVCRRKSRIPWCTPTSQLCLGAPRPVSLGCGTDTLPFYVSQWRHWTDTRAVCGSPCTHRRAPNGGCPRGSRVWLSALLPITPNTVTVRRRQHL